MVMQDTQNNATSNEYRSVPISILVESATNPRKRFDEKLSLGHVASEQQSWRN
jgi:hypothetical protein